MLCVSAVVTFDVHASSLVGDARSIPRPLAFTQGSHHLHILHYLILLFCYLFCSWHVAWRNGASHGVEDHTPFSDGA